MLVILSGALTWFVVTFKTPAPTVAEQKPPVNKAGDQLTGFIRHLTLPDGTTVVLQANSRLRYPEKFTGNTREITLSGEAYFDVAHDAQKPFIIHTGKIRTTVLGTAFKISAMPGGKK